MPVTIRSDNVLVALDRRVCSGERRQDGQVIGSDLRRLNHRGGVKDSVENQIALSAVVTHAKAAAQNGLVVAIHVVSKPKTRLGHDAATLPAALRDLALICVSHSVERVTRTWDNLAAGRVNLHGVGGIVGRRDEQGDLILGVALRRNPCETHSVVQCQAICYLPGILEVELKLVVTEVSPGAGGGLVETLKEPQQRGRYRVSDVVVIPLKAVSPHVKTDLAVDVAPGNLIFSAALIKDSSLI